MKEAGHSSRRSRSGRFTPTLLNWVGEVLVDLMKEQELKAFGRHRGYGALRIESRV